ncbi:MAG TPA: RNHCP domain-containing protein [Thermomicrobiaceae bacterium]|nr:RNHCP domain-containing protein [Thermomicrobiaceae bacterium]
MGGRYRDNRRFDDYEDDEYDDYSDSRHGEERIKRRGRGSDHVRRPSRTELRAARRPETESFRCVHCKTIVGPTISGGRHRNHCPLCLYSRHVDGPKPGDRASECRAAMEPIGTFYRSSGEQVLVHHCRGCGFTRWTRVAADDNTVLLEELPVLSQDELHDLNVDIDPYGRDDEGM